MKLTVIGSGYVGLVAGACFSDTGNEVAMVDMDPVKVDMLRRGEMSIYEPGLDELVARNAAQGRLTFTTDLAVAVGQAEVVILAVGTPAGPDGSVDMRQMETAATQVGRALKHYTVIATKSTVPVGTHRRIAEIVSSVTDVEFDYVSNPEFLQEGAAVEGFIRPHRVILGLTSDRALRIMRHLYSPFMRRSDRLLVMDPASAELTKYACNAMLATRVTFMNELAKLCDYYGASISDIRHGMGTDRRIGPDFLYPSLGYGGSCLPKDVQGLMSMGRVSNHPMRTIEAVHAANQEQREMMYHRVRYYFDGKLKDKTFAVWGLAFKARTDDVRESPAITVVQRLVGSGASVSAYDPEAIRTAREVLGDRQVRYARDMYDAVRGADALIVCTEWREFRTPDFNRVASLMAGDVIFDGRNLYDLEWLAATKLRYYSVGRPAVNPKTQ
ncbi:MAG TPA: UDP-glucose/GDP-mannose dehydrogenase family protein [Phycisphaerae bacterium]|nr:UDP-glucose/GDP-mannose dehydrogenase family protein [Phycisphaerae bacterium]